jgi:hypothetical protein
VTAAVVHSVVAVAPALPLHTAGKYVAGAYIAFLAIVLIYVAIMATRLGRTERELTDLAQEVERRRRAVEARGAEARGADAREADGDREPVA